MDTLREWRQSLPQPTLEAAGRRLGISAVQMWRLENGARRVPPTRAVEFETITGIPREKLRPDVFGPESEKKRA